MTQIIPIGRKISNIFLVKGKQSILVDTASPKEAENILYAMQEHNVSDLALIVHTHAHMDHCGCSAELQRKLGVPLAIGNGDAEYFAKGANAPIVPTNLLAKCLMPFMNHGFEAAKPDIIIENELDLEPFGVAGKIISTPGHTPGSISILFESGDVIAGDMLGGGRLMGLIQPERPRHHYFHWDFDQNLQSIAKILAANPARIYVGHGGPLDGKAAKKLFSK